MDVKHMDPVIIRKLLEGHRDVLTPAAEQSERYYAAQSCPRCGGSCRRMGDLSTMFKEDQLLPQFYLECLACGCVFEPQSGLVLEMGNVGQAVEPAIPILKTED